MMNRTPHPGAHLRARFADLEVTATAAAKSLKLNRVTLARVLTGRASLTPNIAARLHLAFGIPIAESLAWQSAYDNHVARRLATSMKLRRYNPANKRTT